MKTAIKNWFTVKTVGACLLGVLVIYFATTAIVDVRLSAYEQTSRLQIADQQTVLLAIAEATGRNGVDVAGESIIHDCAVNERTEFDSLLSRLNVGLSQTELITLERLFGRCGSFFSDRKSLMSSRLTREIEIYETYVTQLSILLGDDLSGAFLVQKWKALAAEEERQSELFGRLVGAQDKIIATLLSGKSANSDEIQEILQEAKEIQETLLVANKQASTLRAELVPL